MAKGDELVKYITEQVVSYMETPREERKRMRVERRSRARESWERRWFGMLPMAVSMWLGRLGKKRKAPPVSHDAD